MRVFDCQCDWRFIIGDTHVYGPIYEVPWASRAAGESVYSQGRLMTIEQFADNYADCAYNAAMTNTANQDEHVHPFTD